MDNTCTSGSYWVLGLIIIVIIIIIALLWLWASPWDCSICQRPNTRRDLDLDKPVKTFHVTVEEKNRTHPNYGKGSKLGYVIDGIQGKSLTLKVNTQYQFIVKTEGHPLYIGTSEKGNGPEKICPGSIGVNGTPTENGSFTFIPTLEMPQPLYYSCKLHESMGSSIIIEI